MNLWLSGVRTPYDTKVEFPIGISALTGNSGSGKTTLVMGLCWIIFGSGGDGPHRAINIKMVDGLPPAGALRLRFGADEVVVIRITPGPRPTDPPDWVGDEVRRAIRARGEQGIPGEIWINGKLSNFEAERLRIFGTRKTFTSISVIPQKLPSFLLGSEKLSHTIQEFFFPDKGPDCPMTYIEPLQYRSGILKKDIESGQRVSELVDERVSRARQALCDIANVLVAGLSIGGKSRVVRSGDLEKDAFAAREMIMQCSHAVVGGGVAPSPRQLADQVRTLLHARRAEYADWEKRFNAATSARQAVPNLEPSREAYKEAERNLIECVGPYAETVLDPPSKMVEEAAMRASLARQQAALEDALSTGNLAFPSIQAARDEIERAARVEDERRTYFEQLRILLRGGDSLTSVMSKVRIDVHIESEAHDRAIICEEARIDILALYDTFCEEAKPDHDKAAAERRRCELANVAGATSYVAKLQEYGRMLVNEAVDAAATLSGSEEICRTHIKIAHLEVVLADESRRVAQETFFFDENAARLKIANDRWEEGQSIYSDATLQFQKLRDCIADSVRKIEIENATGTQEHRSRVNEHQQSVRTRDDAIRRRADAEKNIRALEQECLDMFFSEESLARHEIVLEARNFYNIDVSDARNTEIRAIEEINRSILAEHRASVTERKRIIDEAGRLGAVKTMARLALPGALEKLKRAEESLAVLAKCPECEADVRIVGTKLLPVTSQEHPHSRQPHDNALDEYTDASERVAMLRAQTMLEVPQIPPELPVPVTYPLLPSIVWTWPVPPHPGVMSRRIGAMDEIHRARAILDAELPEILDAPGDWSPKQVPSIPMVPSVPTNNYLLPTHPQVISRTSDISRHIAELRDRMPLGPTPSLPSTHLPSFVLPDRWNPLPVYACWMPAVPRLESIVIPQMVHGAYLQELEAFAIREIPASVDTSIASACVDAYLALEAYNKHVNEHGPLDRRLTKFPNDEASRLMEIWTRAQNAHMAIAANAEEQNRRAEEAEARVGPQPPSPEALEGLPEALVDLSQFDQAYAEFNAASNDKAAIDDSLAKLKREYGLVSSSLEIVNNERDSYISAVMGGINETANHVLSRLFEGHVQYVLKKDDKHRICSVLQHNGRDDVELNALSGGELDRFSIAVAVAFSHFRGSPILIFDETIASLDPVRRAECVEVVSKLLPNKIVIFITHDPPQGLFESTLSMHEICTFAQ